MGAYECLNCEQVYNTDDVGVAYQMHSEDVNACENGQLFRAE